MRTWLTPSLRLLQPRGNTPFAKHALAECAKFDANHRLLSSFNAAWPHSALLQKRSSPEANGITSANAVGVHLLLKSSYNPTTTVLRRFCDGNRGDEADPPHKLPIPEAVASWVAANGLDSIVVKKVNITKLQAEFWMGHDDEQNRNRPYRKLEDETDTYIVDHHASCLQVCGRAENVKEAVKRINSIVVEKVNITKLQAEFWMGHDEKQSRNRPRHQLEDNTDTFIVYDHYASCLHVSGRAENVKEAVKRIRASQHMKLLYRVDSEQEDAEADEADQKMWQEIDLHEAVLEVPAWALSLARKCALIEQSTTSLLTSQMINGRGLFTIACSPTTVKRGTEEVLGLLTSNSRYEEGDIRLRRIEGQPVDTAGFEEAEPVGEEDHSNYKKPFEWERLTRERWQFVGRSSAEET